MTRHLDNLEPNDPVVLVTPSSSFDLDEIITLGGEQRRAVAIPHEVSPELVAQGFGGVLVIARTTKGSAVSLFHTQMWPGLSVEASNKAGLVTVSVADAGEPVPGATVGIGGHSLRTDERGQASLKLRAGTYRVAASKTKYVGANTTVRVKTVPPNGRP